ncbi:MAG: deoxyribonuclease IV [Candidatus Omnitrophica bacterium]|nr:deoxyribonuclease IV [Candidatus Omnitrophota bacterium]
MEAVVADRIMKKTTRRGPALGAHMSIAGGFERSIERGLKAGCDTIQIFSKSNNQWAAPPIKPEDVERFQEAARASGIGPVFAHTAYLINVGSPERLAWEKSREALKVEVERADALGLAFVVHHPGSRKESDEEGCLKRIAEAVSWVLEKTPGSKVKVLYEIAAGQGSCVGHTFEHLSTLLALTKPASRIGICLDTCHLFAAGYDIRTKAAYEKTMGDFDRIVGIKHVEAIHLNDSKKELGCRVDRHEHIGRGRIGLEGFRCLMNDQRFRHVPMVLETPKDEETLAEDIRNLKVLRGLVNRG